MNRPSQVERQILMALACLLKAVAPRADRDHNYSYLPSEMIKRATEIKEFVLCDAKSRETTEGKGVMPRASELRANIEKPPQEPSWRDEPTGYVDPGPTITTNVTPPVAATSPDEAKAVENPQQPSVSDVAERLYDHAEVIDTFAKHGRNTVRVSRASGDGDVGVGIITCEAMIADLTHAADLLTQQAATIKELQDENELLKEESEDNHSKAIIERRAYMDVYNLNTNLSRALTISEAQVLRLREALETALPVIERERKQIIFSFADIDTGEIDDDDGKRLIAPLNEALATIRAALAPITEGG